MASARIVRGNLRTAVSAIGSFRDKKKRLLEEYSRIHFPFLLLKVSPREVIPSSKLNYASNWSRGIRTIPHDQFPVAERALAESDSEYESDRYPGLEPTKPGEKPRVVVLGTGWAACRFMKGLDMNMYDIVCLSPRNHMVFAPLLPSTCVGTLEFRSVAEPHWNHGMDTAKHEVYCEMFGNGGLPQEPLTFSIKGVKDHAYFLREVNHAQEIRKKLLLNLMLSENPGISEEERKHLLHYVVIGGGPTGVEFSGELSDFIMKDANEILSSFNVGLRQYATNHLKRSGICLKRGVAKEVHTKKIVLSDDTDVPYGLLVWSTGIRPSKFIKSLDLPKSPGGRIGDDEWLRVPSVEEVFALGDCAGFLEQTGKLVLLALAQVVEREGTFLEELFRRIGKQNGGKAFCSKDIPLGDPFITFMIHGINHHHFCKHSFMQDAEGISHTGFVSWLVWRSAYLTRIVS
ncbi:hypothetical protein EUGRSUZ_E03405 [Eucalyptus grandis]|uniref:Uncharacterized protein n=2 Tax=Eucalyptus grandis TaxID=71139 RepID=A0ACC3L190_EUCGR|nr:hypothetical protein EUGRSUZ_E03405 [Eucalyptus grandis]